MNTTNLGLHQYEAADPVLHTDFNSDNVKIDKAIGAIPLVKLKEIVAQADATAMEIDVSDIDFDAYKEVIAYADLVNTNETDSVSPYCAITINDITSGSKYGSASSDDMNSSTAMNISYILYPGIISSQNGFYYKCERATLRFKKMENLLVARCEYGYMNRQNSYYFRSSAGLVNLDDDVPVTKITITVGNVSNNAIAAGSKLIFMGVKE